MSIIRKHLSEVSECMSLADLVEVESAVMALEIVRKNKGTVYLFGNGGSHTTAGHFANDLMKMARIRAVCIGDMAGAMLAYGNDNGWENMFVDPLREMMGEHDAAVGISCSGKSVNVISALGHAVGLGALSIGLTGQSLDSEINYLGLNALIHAPYPDIRVQEDIHLMVCHAMVRALQ
jgi:D-sedoheptulose 7-phosphate isomerase